MCPVRIVGGEGFTGPGRVLSRMIRALSSAVQRVTPGTDIVVVSGNDRVYDGEFMTVSSENLPGEETVIVRQYGCFGCEYETFFEYDPVTNTAYIPVEKSDQPVVVNASEVLVDSGLDIGFEELLSTNEHAG